MSKIHLISGPRNISTALMYSFGNRADMSIVDEPFYGQYLTTHPEIEHPGKAETLASMSSDFQQVLDTVIRADYPTESVFFKNMAHHMDGHDWSYIKELKNIFLIRDPAQLIASFAQVIPEPTMLDIGLQLEWEIYEYAQSIAAPAVVVDSNNILSDPKAMLEKLCETIGIPFSEEMLHWEAGPRAEDGSWAKYWYENVHKSTGFARQETSDRTFPERLRQLLDEAQGYYNKLAEHSIRV